MRALPASLLAVCGLIATACGSTGSGGAAAGQAAQAAATTLAPAPAQARTTPQARAKPQAAARPLEGKTIVIDPGHNGGNYRDPKAVNRKVNVLTKWKPCDTTGTETDSHYTEAAFTWDVSNRVVKILKARGAAVKLTRADNSSVGPCITERAAIGNKAKADAAISVHGDGAPAANHGFHVIMPKKINGPVDPVVADSRKLGLAVRDAYKKETGLPYSTYIGSKALDFRNDLGGLNLSTVPKIFIECGNMRNPAEAAKFQNSAFRQRIAVALADGLQHYLKA
ncbi:N-acetylmuramoyl-L-alanine amidase [Nonomuraea sp. NEAU-A123]|uniref:N-acetylmuramoyl-L-alanine amidase n=1 Tax=Nonomuraea sp. NEAU-A123 TaxID=2839649 RepID=UPI001BE43C1C|nr:N-acetylmuramoyl-L-alanine amidase [Nonomuraea sp. NEAU-A123]MBT2234636.1 N-acetylmuramoyl-L-alanine amidase [Nonomuraea sp. NEAU-A123]